MHLRPYANCLIQGSLTVKGLYDTGAVITCMSKKTFRKIPVDKRPAKLNIPNRSVGCADSQSMVSLGTYKMDIKVNGHQVQHEVKVFNQLNEDFILGIDFIEPHKFYYDPSQHTCGTPPSWSQGALKLRQQVKLDPLSVMQVPVKIVTEAGTISLYQLYRLNGTPHQSSPFRRTLLDFRR